MRKKIIRTGVSLPADLLREFDELTETMGYRNRSKAIGDAMIRFVSEYRWREVKGEVIGVISLIYNRETPGVSDALTEIEHTYSGLILSTMHVHLDPERCLEITVTRGRAEELKGFAGKLMSQRGVESLKLFAH